MKISLIGFGKMGKVVNDLAKEKNLEICSIIDPASKEANFREISIDSIGNADVCIDFTNPGCVVDNIKKVVALGKNLVVGTTGWYNKIDEVRSLVNNSKIGFVYGSNFSIGMNLFYRIIDFSSNLFNRFSEYDVAGQELHHNLKADSPSGTAIELSNIILKNIERKKNVLFGNSNGKINCETLQFTSNRCGFIPGTHKIIFDSYADTIELIHSVRNRLGFAEGALLSAKMIADKKGFFTFNELLTELIK
jgi:4-hydroxy-tetrahydrodipicolinate reductase